jgi:hypothetical protein
MARKRNGTKKIEATVSHLTLRSISAKRSRAVHREKEQCNETVISHRVITQHTHIQTVEEEISHSLHTFLDAADEDD